MTPDSPVPVSADAATRERRDEWKRLAEAATEGPWVADSHEIYGGDGDWVWIGETCALGADDNANAAFIAAARTAVPDLIAQVEALESERDALRGAIWTILPSIRSHARPDAVPTGPAWFESAEAVLTAALAGTEETK